MIIASCIVKVEPTQAEEIAALLNQPPRFTTFGIHKENNLILVVELEYIKEMEQTIRNIMDLHTGILAVFPTYMEQEEESV